MLTTITIPRPHVPTGPEGVPPSVADAEYLRAVIRKIDGKYAVVGGSGVTAMVRKLLVDVVDVLDAPPTTPGRDIAQLIRDLVDPDECWFDHNGGCQAHGYLSLEHGEMCPHAEAKAWLVKVSG